MRIQILAASLSGLLALGASSARAHDEGCDYEDRVTAVERGYGADVVHYDHHHYYYDEYGNPYVVHHDHHYVVPNDDYGYGRQYYNTGYGRQYYRHHRRHRAAFSVFFGG
jgi:hypothetical protein